jgi:hypothetical protein
MVIGLLQSLIPIDFPDNHGPALSLSASVAILGAGWLVTVCGTVTTTAILLLSLEPERSATVGGMRVLQSAEPTVGGIVLCGLGQPTW